MKIAHGKTRVAPGAVNRLKLTRAIVNKLKKRGTLSEFSPSEFREALNSVEESLKASAYEPRERHGGKLGFQVHLEEMARLRNCVKEHNKEVQVIRTQLKVLRELKAAVIGPSDDGGERCLVEGKKMAKQLRLDLEDSRIRKSWEEKVENQTGRASKELHCWEKALERLAKEWQLVEDDEDDEAENENEEEYYEDEDEDEDDADGILEVRKEWNARKVLYQLTKRMKYLVEDMKEDFEKMQKIEGEHEVYKQKLKGFIEIYNKSDEIPSKTELGLDELASSMNKSDRTRTVVKPLGEEEERGFEIYFGLSNGRGKPGLTMSTRMEKHHDLIKRINGIVKPIYPDFKYAAMTINKSNQLRAHCDFSNVGVSLIMSPQRLGEKGGYEDGRLVIHNHFTNELTFHDLHHVWLFFDGQNAHFVEPFTGERWTIIFYTPSKFWECSPEEKLIAKLLGFPVPDDNDEEYRKCRELLDSKTYWGPQKDRVRKLVEKVTEVLATEELVWANFSIEELQIDERDENDEELNDPEKIAEGLTQEASNSQSSLTDIETSQDEDEK